MTYPGPSAARSTPTGGQVVLIGCPIQPGGQTRVCEAHWTDPPRPSACFQRFSPATWARGPHVSRVGQWPLAL
eukprot:3263931-Pyramimonas_sp.AAC.1